jgi:protein-glutamine gamma-glutamyltransferase
MSIHRALRLNTAALAVMGALFLSLGHAMSALPLLLAIAAVAAVILGELLPWLRLNRIVANVVALAAVAWSLKDFFSVAAADQLVSIANMLVYLQIVLLFQEKSARVYWQLVVLSLLQVVVAAALSLGFYFALLLGIYILLALAALVLLCIYRDLEPPLSDKPVAPVPSAEAGFREGWKALLASPQVTPAGLSGPEVAQAFRSTTLFRLVGGLAGATLVFTAVFFYSTPRLSEGSWTGTRRSGASTSGIAEHVEIEEQGRIHLSNRLVMRVSITNELDGKPASLIGEPYFHGFVLGKYMVNGHRSRWSPSPPFGTLSPSPPRAQMHRNLVRQDVVLEQADPPVIFAMLPFRRIGDTPRGIFYDRAGHRIRRRDDEDSPPVRTEFRYAAGTLSVASGRQLHGLPNPNYLHSFADAEYLDEELTSLREFDPERFAGLAAVAEEALREENLEQASDLERAVALERHFLMLDRYRYSLNLDFSRDPQLDPIEDFVVNHRTGHCEYFASALALMLRSQGIPARLVVGFKGGDYNSLGRYYVVQQQHAHAWVEAWMPPGMVDETELAGPPSPGGTWYRLDPTPISLEGQAAADGESLVRRIEHAFDYVDLIWRDYVLGLTADRQQGTVYDPLTERTGALPFIESRRGRRWLRQWSQHLGLEGALPRDRVAHSQAIASGIAIAVVGTTAVLIGLLKLSLVLGHFVRRLWRRGSGETRKERRPPAFYVRLERLLARLPLRRASGQTPRELAAAASRRLSNGAARVDVAHVPGEVVDAYYRVRFGSARLDKNETEQIEQALASLIPAVSQAQKK